MNCSNCGVQLPDGSVFCSVCGQKQAPPVSFAAPPVGTATLPPSEVVIRKPCGRMKYLCTEASGKTRGMAIVCWVTALLCAVLLLLMHFYTLQSPVEEYPLVSVGADMLGAEIDIREIRGYIDEGVEQGERLYDEYGELLPPDLQEKAEEALDILEDCADELSPANLSRLMEMLRFVTDELKDYEGFRELEGYDEIMDRIEEVERAQEEFGEFVLLVFDLLYWGLWVLALLAAGLGLFGGIFFLRTLAVFALIFSCLYTVLFSELLLIAVYGVLFILMIVLQCLVRADYKHYCEGFYLRV